MEYSDCLQSIKLEVYLCGWIAALVCGWIAAINDTRRFGSKRATRLVSLALLLLCLNASHPNGIFELIDPKKNQSCTGSVTTAHMSARRM